MHGITICWTNLVWRCGLWMYGWLECSHVGIVGGTVPPSERWEFDLAQVIGYLSFHWRRTLFVYLSLACIFIVVASYPLQGRGGKEDIGKQFGNCWVGKCDNRPLTVFVATLLRKHTTSATEPRFQRTNKENHQLPSTSNDAKPTWMHYKLTSCLVPPTPFLSTSRLGVVHNEVVGSKWYGHSCWSPQRNLVH